MFFIDDILVNDEIYEENFICNIKKCKGACCWEGDFGAPLDAEEIEIIEKDLDKIMPFLSDEGQKHITEKGFFTYYEDLKKNGTGLLPNAHCIFLTFKEGIGKCGIEQAYENEKTSFKKPISCHLYPIRVDKNEENGFDVLKYDKWDICSEACKLGEQKRVRVFEFLKEALVRKYGSVFYSQLESMVSKFINKI